MASKQKVSEIMEKIQKEGRKELMEHESKQILAFWGIPTARTELAENLSEAVRLARELRYPVVMKIASTDILHKSDAGGVKVGIGSEFELRRSFDEIMANAKAYKPDANICGVTVQEYIPPAREVIVGTLQDPSFGPAVMFGLGGIWVEVLKDVSFRLAPLSPEDAQEMIGEIKGYPVLAGMRGEPPADIDALVDILQKTGRLADEFPEISEMDINPIFVREKGRGAIAADARIVLGEKA